MDNLEKAIKGLELCEYQEGMPQCDSCPYVGKQCWRRLKAAALALLKAQEWVKPVMCEAHAQGANDVWYECGGCHAFLGINRKERIKCPKCGKLVKWE